MVKVNLLLNRIPTSFSLLLWLLGEDRTRGRGGQCSSPAGPSVPWFAELGVGGRGISWAHRAARGPTQLLSNWVKLARIQEIAQSVASSPENSASPWKGSCSLDPLFPFQSICGASSHLHVAPRRPAQVAAPNASRSLDPSSAELLF